MVKLGSKVRDVVNGYEGIATARCEYLNGCVAIVIEGPLAKNDNGIVQRDDMWVDEQRVEVLKEGGFVPQGDYAPEARPDPVTAHRLARAGGPTGPIPPRDGAR